MNYRHSFHAGNFADVLKHAVLARILAYAMGKEAPLRFIDTHAGAGLYDLGGAEAARTGEWRDGIGRIPPDAHPLLQPWLAALGPRGADLRPQLYPGSSILAQSLLRAQDRLSLCEIHPAAAETLAENIGRDRRAHVVKGDGYAALNALVPPRERRGIVLIDPPFEAAGEFLRMEAALGRALSKWPTGIYMLWHPVKDGGSLRFWRNLPAIGCKRALRLEISVGGDGPGLTACGLMVVNPPHVLEGEAQELLPELVRLLARGPSAGFQVESVGGR